MATLSASSSSLLFTSPSSSNLPTPSLSLPRRLFSLSSQSLSSFSLFIAPSAHNSTYHVTRCNSLSSFTVKASSSADKKKVLIVNTNSGGHAVIGFYFAKQLLGSGHQVTILTVGEESSDKMNKPPFTRFSVKIYIYILCFSFSFFYSVLFLGIL